MLKMLLLLVLLYLVGGGSASAQAASATVTLQFNSPPSTAVTCTPNYPSGQQSFPLPQAAGAVMATCAVQPTTWLGKLTVTGNSAFGVNGTQIVVGSAGYNTSGSVTLTVTATP